MRTACPTWPITQGSAHAAIRSVASVRLSAATGRVLQVARVAVSALRLRSWLSLLELERGEGGDRVVGPPGECHPIGSGTNRE